MLKKLGWTALAGLFLAATVDGSMAPASVEDLDLGAPTLSGNYLAGRFASRQRDNDIAARYFERALEDDPGNPVLLERAFLLNLSSGQVEQAKKLARRVLDFNAKQRLARVVLGLDEFKQGSPQVAREHFSKAAFTPVGELTASLLTAWSWAGEGKLNEAMSALDALDGNDVFANFKAFHAALIADFLKSPSRAEELYKRAYDKAGTSLRVVQAYGNYLARTGRKEQAAKVYETFLEDNPSNSLVNAAAESLAADVPAKPFLASARAGMAEAMFSLASALSSERNSDLALVYGQLALSMRPEFAVARTLLGEIYEDTKRYDKAVTAFREVPSDSPLGDNAELQIAINLNSLDRAGEAIARLEGLLQREPENYSALVTLGNIQRSEESWAEAAEAYSRAIATLDEPGEEHWSLFYFRGIAYERSADWDNAEADFKKALELSPDQPSVLNYLGYSWIDKGMHLNQALEMVRKAVELRPNDGFIIDSLGWAHYKLGQFEEAVKYLERAVQEEPADPVINEHLGDAYWRVGRELEARFQWQHAKDNKPELKNLKEIERKLEQGLGPVEEAPVAPMTAAEPDES